MHNKLIDKFWDGHATEEERRQLLQQIRELEKDDMQWLTTDFLLSLEAKAEVDRDDAWFAAMREKLNQKIAAPAESKAKLISFRKPVWWAVAASILVTAGVMLWYAQTSTPAPEQMAKVSVPPAIKEIIERNSSGNPKQFKLPDASAVQLEPGAEIAWHSDYGIRTRSIVLRSGRAKFKVEKDQQKPFSVVAGNIRTTALGTIFSVSLQDSSLVKVKLLEGSVLVNASTLALSKIGETILIPGQEISVNLRNASKQVTTGTIKSPAGKAYGTNGENVDSTEGLQFSQQSLSSIFKQLGRHYEIKILFDKKKMASRWFTGSFEQGDSLGLVLTAICQMNDLSFTKEGDSYIISEK